MQTTLNAIREHSPCIPGWTKLLRSLGKTAADGAPLSIITILESNGLDDALWCLRAVKYQDREIRMYAVWCARQVQALVSASPCYTAVLDVVERFANGEAGKKELNAVAATGDYTVFVARVAARDADAGGGAGYCAYYTAKAAAGDASRCACAGHSHRAKDAVEDSTRAAVRAAQEERLREVCGVPQPRMICLTGVTCSK